MGNVFVLLVFHKIWVGEQRGKSFTVICLLVRYGLVVFYLLSLLTVFYVLGTW